VIDGLPVGDMGATALLAIVVLMVLTGRLVPRRTLTDLKEERDHWRTAAEERSSQLSDLLSATDTSTRLIEALTDATKDRQEPR
jgi:hypothetical protein